MVSNVDNLGARVDPVVVGMHLHGRQPLTCEVARKEGDMGGAPVRVDGKLQLVEGPRFPPRSSRTRAGLQHELGALRHRDARCRTTTSPGCTCARRSPGATLSSSSASTTRSRRSSHAVPRGAASRPARSLLSDQDAGRPHARAGRPARARRSVAGLTYAERTWRKLDTKAFTLRAYRRCVRVLDLVLPERCAVCEVPGRALCDVCRGSLDETGAARLRAMRLARPVASASLCRVLGKAARVRLGARGDRL